MIIHYYYGFIQYSVSMSATNDTLKKIYKGNSRHTNKMLVYISNTRVVQI